MLIYLRKNLKTKKYILTNVPLKSYSAIATFDFKWINRDEGKFECHHKGGTTRYSLCSFYRGNRWCVGVRIANQNVVLTVI